MTGRERAAPAGFGVLILLTSLAGPLVGMIALLPLLAMLVYGGRVIPRFYRTLGKSIAAGVVAGLLVLAPAFRLAMRVVNIFEPTRAEEFTIEGTLFIVIFIGAIGGIFLGPAITFIKKGLGLGVITTNLMTGLIVLGFLMAGADIRAELMELGAGPSMNIPMFFAAGFLYGWATQALFGRIRFRPGRSEVESRLDSIPA